MSKKNTEKLNYYCMMLEGALNTIGVNLLGVTTLIPLFLQTYGANMKVVGLVSALAASLPMIVPIFVGDLVSMAKSKRQFIIRVNSVGRGMIIIMAPVLILHLEQKIVVIIFICIFSLFYIVQATTGLAWTDLLGKAVAPSKRGYLLGNLQVIAGVASVVASYFVKIVLDSGTLLVNQKYAIIFGLSGTLLLSTVLAMIPLREPFDKTTCISTKRIRQYFNNILACFNNKSFKIMTLTLMCSTAASSGLSFIFLFAKNTLNISPNNISGMFVIQTLGSIAGGLLYGKIFTLFGSKYVIQLSEISALLIPLLSLSTYMIYNDLFIMYIVAFLMGIKNGGMLGYTNYLIEILDEDLRVHGMVARSTLTSPFTFLNFFAGILVDTFGIIPLFILQIGISTVTVIFTFLLKANT